MKTFAYIGLIAIVLALGLTGCIKNIALYDNGKVLPIEFFNGMDLHGGLNGIDETSSTRKTLARNTHNIKVSD